MSEAPKPTRDTLIAFVDGELSPEEMTRVAALLAQHADLRTYVARQQALRNRLDESFSPFLAHPVPLRLQQAAQRTPRSWVATFSKAAAQWRGGFQNMLSWRVALPVGAALALGLIVGVAIERASPVPSLYNGQVVAQGALAYALSEQLASEDNRAGPARVGISFRDKLGQDCRTFTLDANTIATSGVACHSGGTWVIAALTSAPQVNNPQAPYQMAGAAMPATIRNTVNAMIAGAPFDAAAERRARARGWRGAR